MQYHEIANIFPLLDGNDFATLKDDIAQNGLLEPIWLHPDGRIIDGRNRHRACVALGIEPQYRTWRGDGSLVQFIVSLNLHRRHLTSSQKAVIALEVEKYLAVEARQRQEAGNNQHRLKEIIPEGSQGQARDQAAAIVGTNGRYVQDAKRIRDDAPDLIDSVRDGGMTIPQAKRILQDRETRPHVANNSGNNEWYTPAEYIEAARVVLGAIDLDPASSDIANKTVGATTYYTSDDDGLQQDWHGRVWMNPPYAAGLIDRFSEKLAYHVGNGDVSEAIVLVNNATETVWFGRLVEVAAAVCFPRSRVRFLRPDGEMGAPLQGQAVLYIGTHVDKFRHVFSDAGWTAAI